MSEEKLYLCVCSGEGLVFSVDEDGLLLSIWRVGSLDTGWRTRLWHIWQIVKHGRPNHDDIILDWRTFGEFRGALDKAVGDYLIMKQKADKHDPPPS